MSLDSLLLDLNRAGISLSAKNDALVIEAKKGALTAELQQRLRAAKEEILAWLNQDAANSEQPIVWPQCVPNITELTQPFALSDLQRGFVMAENPFMELHVRPHYYSEKTYLDFSLSRYQQAWNTALKRHEKEWVLVRPEGDLQIISAPEPLVIAVTDLGDVNATDRDAVLLKKRGEMSRQELPLNRWPWFELQATLWQENGLQYGRVHYNHNNFFADGGGTARFLREIDRYYQDAAFRLPPLSLSIRDALLALDDLSQSPAGQADRDYWENRLATFPSPIELPLLTSVNRRCRSKLNRRHFYMDASRWQRFKLHAEQAGITPSNAVFAAYTELLSAWSNQSHFIISNMMTRRLPIHPEIRDIMGNFASLYPLEVRLDKALTFAERALQLQQQVYQDSQHLRWGGIEVMRQLNQNKDSLGQAPLPFVIGSGLFMDKVEPPEFACLETSQVMLDHQFWELTDGRYYFVWDVLEQFFPEGLLDAMGEAYVDFLEQLADDPTTWQEKIHQFTPTQQQVVREKATPSATEIPPYRLESLIAQNIQQPVTANAIAVRVGENELSYAQLDHASTQIAKQLRIAPGELVGVVMHRGSALVAAVYGVLKAGGVYVPIEPTLPKARRDYLLQNSQASCVLTQQAFAHSLEWPDTITVLVVEEMIGSQTLDNVCDGDERSGHDLVGNEATALSQQDLAYVIYTSGSTGQPKGVMIDHIGALNTVVDINQRFNVNDRDVIFGVSSFGFDLSVYDLFGAIASGATLLYPEPDDALNPSRWLDLIEQESVTVWNSAPALANLLVEAAENRGIKNTSLRLFLLSGDWIPLDLPTRLAAAFPNARIISLGGATEASIWSICYDIDQVNSQWSSIPYGYPMNNQPWFILDHLGRPAADWVTGDLYIGGVGVAKGYWQDEVKTQASFISHPDTGERIYRTGDLGRYHPSGYIEFLGRSDSQIKIQGHRIELGEIEAVVNQHPLIQHSVALAKSSAKSLEKSLATKQKRGADYIAVFYVLNEEVDQADLNAIEDTLSTYLATKVPDYMLPRHWLMLETLPLSHNGKVDRNVLATMSLTDLSTVTLDSVPPQTDLEKSLFTLWKSILQLSDFGIEDDFFDLGGQSIEAVSLVGKIQDTFEVSLSLGDVWQLKTIAELARKISDINTHGAQSANALIPLNNYKSNKIDKSPLFLVHPAGGNVLCYNALAARLSRLVLGLQAPGVMGESAPLGSIPAFAQHYVPFVLEQQKEGLIFLGGWSSGAPIAYEMAAQLIALGREVGGIIMLDSPAPLSHIAVNEHTLFDWFLGDLGLSQDLLTLVQQHPYGGLSIAQSIEKLCSILQQQRHPMGDDSQQLRLIFDVFCGIVNASRTYHAPTINVDIFLLRAQEGLVHEFAQHPQQEVPSWGWQTLSSGKVQTERVSGSHYTLLNESGLSAIVSSIEASIETWCESKISLL